MFGLFKSRPFTDPALGSLQRSRGHWRGALVLSGTPLPLALDGTREAPAAEALRIARQLPADWPAHRESVARALVEHMTPYREAVAAGDDDAEDGAFSDLAGPDGVWAGVQLHSVAITPIGGEWMAEVVLSVSWDEEHLLGARFDDHGLVELNGSTVPV